MLPLSDLLLKVSTTSVLNDSQISIYSPNFSPQATTTYLISSETSPFGSLFNIKITIHKTWIHLYSQVWFYSSVPTSINGAALLWSPSHSNKNLGVLSFHPPHSCFHPISNSLREFFYWSIFLHPCYTPSLKHHHLYPRWLQKPLTRFSEMEPLFWGHRDLLKMHI